MPVTLQLGRRTAYQGLEPLPRHGWEWLRISQALPPHERPDLARPRTPIRYDGHRPVSRLSGSRWPRTVFPLDRRCWSCNLPLGLHHWGASLPDDRCVLTRTRRHVRVTKLASDTYCQGGGVPNCEYRSAAASMTEIRERLLQHDMTSRTAA